MTGIRIASCTTAAEHPVLARALDELLADAAALEQAQVDHSPVGTISDLEHVAPGTICIASLVTCLADDGRPWTEIETALRGLCTALAEAGNPTFLMTVLRCVPDRTSDEGQAQLLQIRRLNLLATELSREFGAFVIDLDRILANVGGLALGSDFRLQAPAAVQIASEEIALAITANGLDDALSYEAQERMKARIESLRSGPQLSASLSPDDLVAMGMGGKRRRQKVSINTDAVQENHVGWLASQVLQGRIGYREAGQRLVMAVRRRGLRESMQLLISALGQVISRRRQAS